jgi:cytochrome P450
MSTAEGRPYDPINVSSMDFWARPFDQRDESLAVLRRERPVSWQPPAEGGIMPIAPDDFGFWAVVLHEDITTVSRDSVTFCSSLGIQTQDFPVEFLEATTSFLGMDPPRHTRVRRLAGAAFTPGHVKRITEQIERQSARIVADFLALEGPTDFIEAVASQLPMWTIAELIGVPAGDRARVTQAANDFVGWNDPKVAAGREPLQVAMDSFVALNMAAMGLIGERRAEPADDLLTALVQAEVDGEQLTDAEIVAFFVLLSIAGNDTTRNTIGSAAQALVDHPDQLQLLSDDFDGHIGNAMEEMLRWACPVMTFRRTATRDVELGGQQVLAGEKVVMFYCSANRDERVFPEPGRFDITRPSAGSQMAFGGGGAHYCLGAFLARTQLRSIFRELVPHLGRLTFGEPEHLVSLFMNGISTLPCELAPQGG